MFMTKAFTKITKIVSVRRALLPLRLSRANSSQSSEPGPKFAAHGSEHHIVNSSLFRCTAAFAGPSEACHESAFQISLSRGAHLIAP